MTSFTMLTYELIHKLFYQYANRNDLHLRFSAYEKSMDFMNIHLIISTNTFQEICK
jgi:hypothetical protein